MHFLSLNFTNSESIYVRTPLSGLFVSSCTRNVDNGSNVATITPPLVNQLAIGIEHVV